VQTPEQLRAWYEIERELAGRLRAARSRVERRRLYGEVYRELAERVPYHPLVAVTGDARARAAMVAPQLRLLRPWLRPETRFCEVGAGDGAISLAVAPHVRSALALDVTDALAPRGPVPGNFKFRVFDGFELGVPDRSLDLVYTNDVVEHLHVDDMLEQSAAIARALAPGGRYVCVTPNRLAGPHDVSRSFSDVADGFHLHEYTVTELAAAFRSAGFGKVWIVVSAGGRHLSPLLPPALLVPIEALLERMPVRRRRWIAHGLAAAKMIATP
jgi:SAM-dependent methyltransferase